MKRLVLITALLVMTALSAGNVLAHMDEGVSNMERGEKYEMMAPGGKHMMGPGMQGQGFDDCRMGGWSMMGGQMHGWVHGGYILVKVIVLGFFFWLLFSIHKSLKEIAETRKKEQP